MPTNTAKTERLYIRLTPNLYEGLAQLMRHHQLPSLSDAGREAVQFYIDHQGDVVGSKRHFNRTLQQRLAQVEDFVHAHSAVQTYLMAQSLAYQLNLLEQLVAHQTGQKDEPKRWKGSDLLAEAVKIAYQQQAALRSTIDKVQEMAPKAPSEA